MEPIIALASAPIKSAIHIIRISGDNVFKIIEKFFTSKIVNKNKRNIFVGFLKNNNKIIDQVVLLTYVKPYSYTGEDVVEIMTHGNLLIDNQIIDLFIANGMRLASNGEFTSRAYLNHKIDLIQAEAVNDLINATTLESKQIITYALEGSTSKLLLPIKTQLLDLISNIEVNIDYPEYNDIEKINHSRIYKDLTKCQAVIKKLIKNGQEGLIIKDGIKVAIVGKPNVGKSTLLNALLKQDKAIVSNIPGTTRDIVEGDVNINGISFHFLDTAGIHSSRNQIETLGISKTFNAIKDANIIIYLKDNTKNNSKIAIKNKKVIEVINKSDLIKNKNPKYLYISAINKDITPLIKEIKKEAGLSNNAYSHPSFANSRELGLLKKADTLINEILKENKNQTPFDILIVLLHELLNIILEIFGEKVSFDITKEIFSRFCVGK